ncbi:MAG: hypothetical protein HW383_18 [Candidatus Magasanikbacteria bacterium]|nr:hypothetical protein [Candidatus Magasanikbacteria bacterium]
MPKKTTSLNEAVLLSLGLAALARERAEKLISALAKEGKTAWNNQAKLRAEIAKRGEKELQALLKTAQKAADDALKMMSATTQREFNALRKKVGGAKRK